MSEKPDVDELDLTDEELVEVLKNHGVNRRNVMRAVGIGGAATLLGSGSAAAKGHGHGEGNHGHDKGNHGHGKDHQPPHIDPEFGYAGSADERVPPHLSPDHTVEVHTREGRVVQKGGHPAGVKFGAFHFEDAGLAVEPGDIVKFDFVYPEHMATAYHPRMGRQRRVPQGTPAFSSPVMAKGDFWLYQFDTPGVYDLFCPPHEEYGMAMRIVVGDGKEDVATPPNGRPPMGLAETLLNLDELDPDAIRSAGSVATESLFDTHVSIPPAVSDKKLGEVAVPLSAPVPADSI